MAKHGLRVAMFAALSTFAVANFDEVSVYFDGKKEEGRFPPILRNGRTLMFLRDTFVRFDAPMKWHGSEQRVQAWFGENEINLWIGKTEAKVNDRTVTLDQPPILENFPKSGPATLVPLRFVGEALEADVKYSARGNRVDINTKTIPLYMEKAVFKVGDMAEMIDPVKGVWFPVKVISVREWADKPDNYIVEYKEPGPRGRLMKPSVRRTYLRPVAR
ncbi:MAG TPA: copper amine oxidase N-terminal domain-containing protein [Fimbriimonadaceae bacterium]|nr:copper amine oxidase N-terminal domain-containing protein [Fimbriimonadaceae bacterium]